MTGLGNIINDLKGVVDNLLGIFGANNSRNYPTDIGSGKSADQVTNVIDYSKKDWRLSRGYAFQVYRVKQDGSSPNKASDWKEHRLQINPQELSQDEIFAITVTPTLRGVIVEHHGVTLKDITISGTTGISPMRREGGAEARSGKPVLQKGHSGYQEFHELRSYFRVYAEAKRLDDKRNGELRMVFKNLKDNENLYVEPQKFSMKRNATRPFMYDYTIQLKAIGTVKDLPKDSGGFFGFLEAIDDAIDTAQGYIDLGEKGILGAIGIIRRFESGVINTVLNPVRSINRALIAVKSGRARFSDFNISRRTMELLKAEIQRVELNFNDAIGRDTSKFNSAAGRSSTLVGTTGRQATYKELQALNSLKAVEKGLVILLAKQELFESKDYAPDNAGRGVDIETPNSVKEVSILGNDTIHTIAARELGSPDKFRDIVLLNNLKPPYISSAGGSRILKPGAKILLPQQKSNNSNKVKEIKEYPITKGMSAGEKSLGVDLRLNEDGEIMISNIKDLDLIAGIQNMSQASALKLFYEKGSLKRFPFFGVGLNFGEKVTDNAAKDVREQILSSFLADTRVESIPFIEVFQEGGTTIINMLVKLRNQEQPVPIPLRLNAS